jgi:hypothetical protein
MSVEFVGEEKLYAAIDRLNAVMPDRLAQELYREAEEMMTLSKEKYVPVDQGILRSSGFVQQPDIQGSTASVLMGFGGPAAAYALIQHENMNYQHTTGQAKYLITPVMERANGMAGRMADRISVRP